MKLSVPGNSSPRDLHLDRMKLVQVYRITTYVPSEHADRLLAAVLEVVPLRYGRYTQVAWSSCVGTEQFCPSHGAQPRQGVANKLEKVRSTRFEFCIPRKKQLLQAVLDRAIIANHPWEEPVIYIEESVAMQQRRSLKGIRKNAS